MVSKIQPLKLPIIGWREWVELPDLGINNLKAKIDTGARSSSLHAFDVKTFQREGETWVRFKVHPKQRSAEGTIATEAKVLEFRTVRSSNGHVGKRPVIVTNIKVLGNTWPIEVTLANRDAMGFRMLLGREGIRGRLLVDSGASYLGGRGPKAKKRRVTSSRAATSRTSQRKSDSP